MPPSPTGSLNPSHGSILYYESAFVSVKLFHLFHGLNFYY